MADSMLTKKVTDLPESTEPTDEDLFIAGNAGTASLRRFKWGNIWNAILKSIRNKVIANDLITTAAGYALDARQGPILKAQYDELNTKIGKIYGTSIVAKFTDGTATIDLKDASGKSYKPFAMVLTAQSHNVLMRYDWDSSTEGSLVITAMDVDRAPTNVSLRFAYIALTSAINSYS